MLKDRFITACILVVFTVIALFLLSPLNFEFIMLAVCILAAWEWSKLSGIVLFYQRILVALSFGVILLLIFVFNLHEHNINSLMTASFIWISLSWWIIALFLVLTYPVSSLFWKYSYLIRILFGILTLVPFFYILSVFRYFNYDKDKFAGSWCILFIIFLTCCIDSSAYFFGKMFGKHKLAPIISPNKTWEGFLFSVIFVFLIDFLLFNLNIINFSKKSFIVFTVIIAFAALLGDLTESMLKREIGIKDSSNIIPGHGGILDRIDSLTTVVPIFGLFMTTAIQWF
ncbi:CDP-diglyceride synthetase [Candidatus Pantoea edessiphila]|uniref:Phosphatidate cytidylyltransferase n=1 Tax=Candidatus Pantoea edessiphila TaxID=2044610 RepID=A0A2P5T0C4_9GAMM|nr:CDP-archaeol synthase [Candidatus Pantoea edessiphila]PPI88002.1 CDP-diglyceride synthetase [Candidatus Pantoea edessiphila]